MRSLLLLPPTLLPILAAADPSPTAIHKLPPDSSSKLFPEHLAFAPLPALFNPPTLDDIPENDTVPRLYMRAYSPHFESDSDTLLRRAAEVLAILERRASCPSGMNSCADMGSPNKCCQEGTYCTDVPDTDVGHVACCPRGRECGGAVGDCPSEAVSCPSSLGGGCCIEGYVCQGVGCVRPGETTTRETSTRESSATEEETSTSTEEPSTTEEPTSTEAETTTEETTAEETAQEPTTRETDTAESTITSAPESSSTQEGCPTGFYGCLATHGGGCCRTDRNCEVFDCPAPSSTTLGSGDVTVVVPGSEVPDTTETCAGGWFLCGEEGGPTAGCCPNGYECGSVSCFTVEASSTDRVQKEFPDEDAAVRVMGSWAVSLVSGLVGVMLML